MTIISTASNTNVTDVLAELLTQEQPKVDMMIGIGVDKTSDHVYFQYVGDQQTPTALSYASGKPLTRIPNVVLTGVSVSDPIGDFNMVKLNAFFSTGSSTLMLTSGLTTIWSQCLITGLMGVLNDGDLDAPLSVDTWKGNSKLRPCFSAVRQGAEKLSDDDTYELLSTARTDRNKEQTETIMRNCIAMLNEQVTGEPVTQTEVIDVTEEDSEKSQGDF